LILAVVGEVLDCAPVEGAPPAPAHQADIGDQEAGNEVEDLFQKLMRQQRPRGGRWVLAHIAEVWHSSEDSYLQEHLTFNYSMD
jgi:hypothetical protein